MQTDLRSQCGRKVSSWRSSIFSDTKMNYSSVNFVFFIHRMLSERCRTLAAWYFALFWPRSCGLQHKQSCSGEFSLNGFEERSTAWGQKTDLDYLSICKKPPLHEPAKKKKKTWSAYTSHSGSNFNLSVSSFFQHICLSIGERVQQWQGKYKKKIKLPTRPPGEKFRKASPSSLSFRFQFFFLKRAKCWKHCRMVTV